MYNDSDIFEIKNGVSLRRTGVVHRNEEYSDHYFHILMEMQREHFWYLGRNRFLLAALKKHVARIGRPPDNLCAIDLGAGCGGWIAHLATSNTLRFKELAVGDSSLKALQFAERAVGPAISRFQVDLLDLGWENRWDVVFLLDVLEHIPEDVEVLRQVRECLAPNGLLFLTTPALKFFWTYNDELAGHQRRYSAGDLQALAQQSGLKLLTSKYFFFFLSPLLYISRLFGPKTQSLSPEQARKHLERTHEVPAKPVNAMLRAIFSMETPLGLLIPFPWGTSVLGVFQKEK
ncbi:MAG: class I SAM-dependent methyltransferase [Verrucomicrobia bacterium]|nr:class I SAM-dependent methyltransferase [Verrucomicrobiota bacterium]MBU1909821.1 class I SAM-dependent methyltransferase [Verrucomicrobiota bacterium]